MNDIHVRIAEVKVGVSGDILRTVLGSCVGIVFIWNELEICGLAHCFLPEGDDLENPISARYVNQAIESLIKLMKIKKKDIEHVEVYVAGGANMMNKLLKTSKSQVGEDNIKAAWKYLALHGFKIKKSNVGQGTGIKMIVDCSKRSVEFIRLENIDYNAL